MRAAAWWIRRIAVFVFNVDVDSGADEAIYRQLVTVRRGFEKRLFVVVIPAQFEEPFRGFRSWLIAGNASARAKPCAQQKRHTRRVKAKF